MIGSVVTAMTEMYAGRADRVNHFLKVYAYSKVIGECENIDSETLRILEVAAVTHDIGILPSEIKYGSGAWNYQEIEGPPVAREMLEKLGFDAPFIDRVCYLIGHHHTYTDIDGMDYQILVEADFLVNIDEKQWKQEERVSIREKMFKTKTGKLYFDLILMEQPS